MTTETQDLAGTPAPTESEVVKQAEPDTPEVTATEGDVEKQEQVKEERKFTQAELDAAIQRRLLKEERRVHRRIEQQMREQMSKQIAEVEPKREAFRDDEEFARAQIEHIAEVKAAEKLAERERVQKADRRAEAFLEKAEKAGERYADFQSVISNPNLRINEEMAEFISESDHGPDVAYFLGKNPLKAADIASMSPMQAARALLSIETEIASKPKATPSKAPEPINPVGSRGKASSSPLPSDDDDMETWARKERARLAQRR